MKFLVGMFMVAMGVFGLLNVVGAGGSNFDFKAATEEERLEWMEKQANALKTGARFFLPNGRGPSNVNFYLDEIKKKPRSREIEMIIRVKFPYGSSPYLADSSGVTDKLCKKFVKTGLYKNDITLVSTFNNDKGGAPLTQLRVTKAKCDRRVNRKG